MTLSGKNLAAQVSTWNATSKDYPLDMTIAALMEQQFAEHPDAIAVRFEEASITFCELNRRANKLAKSLQELGIASNSFVGLYMERSVEMVVAIVGVLKAGAAYVPFDPEYPEDRLQHMFTDSQTDTVITQKKFSTSALPKGITPLYLDESSWGETGPEHNTNPVLVAAPNDPIYMIYTSGSTGKPKGVVNTHKALVNRILWMQDSFPLTSADNVLQKTPYSFDVSVWEFLWPLLTGATIIMARPGGHKDSDYLVDIIRREEITTLHFVPSMLSLFLSASGLNTLTSLKQVMCSGEALPFELTNRFFTALPNTALHNLYGPTEAAIDVTHWACTPESPLKLIPIGKPIANIQTYILNDALEMVGIGEEGELHLAGVGLAREYWNRPELTAEKFIPNPFAPGDTEAKMYKTGDLARYLPDGNIEYLGRLDNQVKLRGFRIELGEIEATLLTYSGVAEATVITTESNLEEKELVACLVCKGPAPNINQLRDHLLETLPDYMVPARFLFLDQMPLSPNGKVDRKALITSQFKRPELSVMFVSPGTETETALCSLWQKMLNLDRVGTHDNFFDLGGNSILAVRMANEAQQLFNTPLPVVKVFEFGYIEKLAAFLDGADQGRTADVFHTRAQRMKGKHGQALSEGVAVVGMAGRFPGADSIDQFWQNLCDGVESISTFGPDELDPWVDEETRNDPNYVPCRGILNNADKFDNKFFGIGPLEAKVMDPQQRVFLELAWAAMENAGYTDDFSGLIGVYAGVGDNHYYTRHVLGHKSLMKTVGNLIVGYGNEKDYIATRVSFALNLTGPSVSANTGCSTSLLAVDHAFKALTDYECDMALAGGVDIHAPQKTGQTFTEGGTFTKDGHCKPFEAEATGTMFSDGAGLVVLKRLEDAIADGDKIYSVIKSVAKNNDGANKVSFLAPSVEGQSQVIALAHAQAGISADTISYIEAHGTGTPLGDPIEIEGLTKAFGLTTDQKQFCKIGSVKGNVGHPTIASGIAGFIKTTLALHHETIPATLHFNKPNPRIDFDSTPFSVVSERTPWPRSNTPRRAGVSSFGFGGTNVHAILEEAPLTSPSSASRNQQVLFFSGKTEQALQRTMAKFEAYFAGAAQPNLADAAYTLQVGRKHFEYRQFVVCSSTASAVAGIKSAMTTPARKLTNLNPHITFMFPGQGSQYVNMGRDLYLSSALFKSIIDQCCDILRPHLDRDLRELLFPAPGDEATATTSLKDTYYTQPALFTIEYALARLWMSYGIQPQAFVGHSVGEFVGACLAGVFSLEDALPLVALRAKLVRSMPKGTMLSVRAPVEQVLPRLNNKVQLAAANSPNLCVVAGPDDAISAFAAACEADGLITRALHTSHAFHSAMMDPVVGDFIAAVNKVNLSAPSLPIMSSCTGHWMTNAEATSPEYWGHHLRKPVMFADATKKLLDEKQGVFLECGPRDVLSTLARQQANAKQRSGIIASLANGGKDDVQSEWDDILNAFGSLWSNGCNIEWSAYYAGEQRHRIPLPTYSFEPVSHWLDPIELQLHASLATEQNYHNDSAEKIIEHSSGEDKMMAKIAGIVQEIIGIPLEKEDESSSFAMLGADSLVLMQMSRVVKERLHIAVSFRQLLEDLSTPKALAEAARANANNSNTVNSNGSQTKQNGSQLTPNVSSPTTEQQQRESQFTNTQTHLLAKAKLGRDANNRLVWLIPTNESQAEYTQIHNK